MNESPIPPLEALFAVAEGGPRRPVIRQLPDYLANQIAAGEVVERPASVVKELVENSLDAGATRIEVKIEAGGKRLIQVIDNGCGMSGEQAALALQRHATSKIATTADLFRITTLGFRGEALPSVGSVSHLELESRIFEEPDGVRIMVRGGETLPPDRVVMPVGTRVTVRNLFFNTPARLKFMRADSTEETHIIDLMQRFILAFPSAGFRVWRNGKEYFSVEAGSGEKQTQNRLAVVFGKEFIDNCMRLDMEREVFRLSGWLGLPAVNRADGALLHLFVNNRWVRDRGVQRAVRDAYGDLLPRERFPAAALFLDVPPDEVDVNVHPAKHEVRFRRQGLIFSVVRQTVQEALLQLGSRAYRPGGTLATQQEPLAGGEERGGEGAAALDSGMDAPVKLPDFAVQPPRWTPSPGRSATSSSPTSAYNRGSGGGGGG
ncbi:MAG: DNA mismatch repair endonuclease MutL, partial [Magnetococcales bacterium]|nr:DNA mismatch repair endonuclease MutL [Magnetococcales bacterium]